MSKKVLLLNSNFEVLAFVSEIRGIKLLCNQKADPLSEWDDVITYPSGSFKLPSILRLKYLVKKNFCRTLAFSRKAVFKRDNFVCQYCWKELRSSSATIDHINPKCFGGQNSFLNCVTACWDCNNKKGNRTPEQAGMFLISRPYTPPGYSYFISENDLWHPEWKQYLT